MRDIIWDNTLIVDKNTNNIGYFFTTEIYSIAIAVIYDNNGNLVVCEPLKIE